MLKIKQYNSPSFIHAEFYLIDIPAYLHNYIPYKNTLSYYNMLIHMIKYHITGYVQSRIFCRTSNKLNFKGFC